MTEERRSETRQNAKDCYSAEIRIVGVPVHEVKLKDLSSKGASILFQNNSSLLNHLQIGKDLTRKLHLRNSLTQKKAPFNNDSGKLTVANPRERNHQKGAETK